MTESTENNQPIDITTLAPELQQVIAYEQVPTEVLPMLVSVYEVSEPVLYQTWEALPRSAQNILDNFEQFHALAALSQSYAGIDCLSEFETLKLSEDMTDEAKEEYKAQLLDQILQSSIKDLCKQMKQARLKPLMKREFREIFEK
ncbi:DUF3069 domain-containing protein [Vibrio sp. SS-MA-C1-2]|uniref:DUF3069 domain-containing protein n=1 Tax=Vibrio sp. SS-MA-C1-2 TaxID=2908646 RepID=UPI001F249747|nr:DUF3069 domain-containing protein [Vibrio sp. SS-MA-C1-2]UJF17380.1 DUF3069 domain-containing protein [Vibrio sp. SS-MA-C1-2]